MPSLGAAVLTSAFAGLAYGSWEFTTFC